MHRQGPNAPGAVALASAQEKLSWGTEADIPLPNQFRAPSSAGANCLRLGKNV